MRLTHRMPNRKALATAVAAVAVCICWQALTVHFNYGENWTALFCTGDYNLIPPELAAENIYRFRGSGYDGQFYHYMAHDPFLRRGFSKYLDAPRLRYRRILVPALAWLAAGGDDRRVDSALFLVIWLSIFLGTYWSSRYAMLAGRSSAWGLLFLAVPATVVAIDRTIVDATLAALTAGFALYARLGERRKLYLVVAAAALTRETGLLLIAGYVFYCVIRKEFRKALLFTTAAAPALVWLFYSAAYTSGDLPVKIAGRPIESLFTLRIFRFGSYSALPGTQASLIHALDWLMAAGVIMAVLFALFLFAKPDRSPEEFAALALAALMIPVIFLVNMYDPFTYARLASPLLLLLSLEALRRRWWIGSAPLALVLLRTAAQLGPQVLGIGRGLTFG